MKREEICFMLVIPIISLGDLRVIKQSLEGPTRNNLPLLRRLRERILLEKGKPYRIGGRGGGGNPQC